MNKCMCGDNVKIQEYQNQVTVLNPFTGKEVCIDRCLIDEIKILWNMGIETTGCCCGHGKYIPFIGVKEEYIESMVEFGYIIQINLSGVDNLDRMDSFYPKSICGEYSAYLKYMNRLKSIVEEINNERK